MPRSFGYAKQGQRFFEPQTQEGSLRLLADLTNRGSIDPDIRATGLQIHNKAKAILAGELGLGDSDRQDISRDPRLAQYELELLYEAVKFGDRDIPLLRRGVPYVPDPRYADYFAAPRDTLRACQSGACGEDCDGVATVVASIAASLGWKAGLRAWGRRGSGGYVHVYPVVLWPKRPPFTKVIALDTTVPDFEAGDEPPRGDVLTAWCA